MYRQVAIFGKSADGTEGIAIDKRSVIQQGAMTPVGKEICFQNSPFPADCRMNCFDWKIATDNISILKSVKDEVGCLRVRLAVWGEKPDGGTSRVIDNPVYRFRETSGDAEDMSAVIAGDCYCGIS